MLKLSLYGFEFYLIKEHYVIFYLNLLLPYNAIHTEEEAVEAVCKWIVKEEDYRSRTLYFYDGPTAQQFKEAYDRLERVSKP